jgi:lipoprotein-anchoring transpeptidase ErfK/SrfK
MQWMTRFRGGIGFHAIPRRNGVPLYTPLGIRPVSHGCIRLGDDQARWIYATVPTGTRVVVK